ncbi:MAG: cytochrome C biogenesis protein ResB [Alphaproteobacteria bacterium]|uniref:Cytochrome C biogenesis protein ResB n=1 Tax=Candidatus Nitrobium versatile TaxID=2884831 RepID=A0A953LXP5_9BACT|nr:cytochrome C biogenesis protein ResB [Candidatus Nitrobium versatile]
MLLLKKVLHFLLSLRTAVWLLCLLITLLLAGAFIMPVAEEFQSLHAVPLFLWLQEQPPKITWWLWGALFLLVLLTANTLFCSVDSVIKKRKAGQWLLLISPQVTHIGFLLILLAHLFSAAGGFKGYAAAREGSLLELPDATSLHVKTISLSLGPGGHLEDWAVEVEYLSGDAAGGVVVKRDRLLPNKPSLHRGAGVYVKDLQAYPEKAVLLEVSREPGAAWALAGGIVFMAGTLTLLALKMRSEG